MNLAYNDTHSGRSIALTMSKTYNQKNEFGLGIRYNINKVAHDDDQMNVFWNRLYAANFLQHWGVETYYHRYIIPEWECTKPYLFYDMQLSYSETKNRMYLPVMDHPEHGKLYKKKIERFGPYTWIEQTIGAGLKSKLTERLYINQKIGAGVIFIMGNDEKLVPVPYGFHWEFAGIYQVGLTYRFQ
ncbi:MAG: hypothetical protein ACK5KP_02600 [Paludibacteraceae bacterium]